MKHRTYIIKFDGVSAGEANRYASELRNILLDATPNVEVDQRQNDPRTQDFGTILILILGTSSVTAIARAVGDWLKLRNSVSITIEDSNRKVIAQNITSKDAFRLTELFVTEE